MFRILVVDSSPRLREDSEAFWSDKHYDIELVTAESMTKAIDYLSRRDFWYIDISADTVNYLPQALIMRSLTPVPIIILTSNFNCADEIAAYDNGADIYAPWEKGFVDQTPERVFAFMTRFQGRTRDADKKERRTLVYGGILLSVDNHRCYLNDMEVPMTKIEFDILYCLMLHKGQVLSQRQIYNHVWGNDYFEEGSSDVICNHVRSLRKKVSVSPDISHIESVRGVGYRFVS
ncbi:response regulator transcription factor [Eubacteriales bacterium OttesenSCG-928-N13]|nr:response regulator transcription factor [Eubacteriales bacterium OttesenSCG-928-N13]